jgi:hypothetical protein
MAQRPARVIGVIDAAPTMNLPAPAGASRALEMSTLRISTAIICPSTGDRAKLCVSRSLRSQPVAAALLVVGENARRGQREQPEASTRRTPGLLGMGPSSMSKA